MLADNISPNSAPISTLSNTIPEWIKGNAPDMQSLRKMFDDARSLTSDNRIKAQKDRDYYDGPEQLNSDVRNVLKMRGQPAIYTNRVRPTIDGILGVLADSKVDPQAWPRNPGKEDTDASDIATKAVRYIADVSNIQPTMLDCAENLFIEGIEAAIIEADGQDIPIVQIRYEEFFYDPYSRRSDFKDAKYMGIAQWKDASVVRAAYPEQWRYMGDPINSGTSGQNAALDATWQDRPQDALPWVDKQRQRMMIVEIYYNEGGKWMHCIYCGAGIFVLEESQFKNAKTGETINPIEAESCYIDRSNARYGRVRDMIPIQDEVNARRSRALHLSNSRQIQEREQGAAVVDANVARKEAARADGVIPPGWQLVQHADMTQGNLALLQEAKIEIERMGPTPGVLAQQSASNSGRAKQITEQAGMTELARIMGRHNDFMLRVYRAAWARAQQFWDGPMWIRVTEETRAPEFLQINEPVMGMVMAPVAGPDGQPMLDEMGQPAMRPQVGQVGTKNRIAEMDLDIVLGVAPDSHVLAEETFAQLADILKTGIDPFSPQFELAVMMSTIPDKTRVLDVIKAKRDEQAQSAQGQQEAAAQAQALDMQELQAKVEKLVAETDKIRAQIPVETAKAAQTEAETAHTMLAPFQGIGTEKAEAE